jgi:hypothetical protein
MLHAPVAGTQVFTSQAVSSTVAQVMTVGGSISHLLLAKLQKSVPLQRLPSSSEAQSALDWHSQIGVPPTH